MGQFEIDNKNTCSNSGRPHHHASGHHSHSYRHHSNHRPHRPNRHNPLDFSPIYEDIITQLLATTAGANPPASSPTSPDIPKATTVPAADPAKSPDTPKATTAPAADLPKAPSPDTPNSDGVTQHYIDLAKELLANARKNAPPAPAKPVTPAA